MGMRALQFLMAVLLTGCIAWASAIFLGPWVLTKYLEGQAGKAVEVSGLRVTPKLAVTASRVQMSDGGGGDCIPQGCGSQLEITHRQ